MRDVCARIVYICLFAYVCMYVYVCASVCMYVYVCACKCVYVCMYMYMYVCVKFAQIYVYVLYMNSYYAWILSNEVIGVQQRGHSLLGSPF